MSRLLNSLRYLYDSHLAQPAAWRPLYRQILGQRVQRLMELGVGTSDRACRLIALAQRASPGATISYTGIDLFELRTEDDGAGLSLKLAHRKLTATGAKVRLVPGDPLSALARTANSLGGQVLLLIAADQEPASLAKAWFYVPRLLGPQATVWQEASQQASADGQPTWRQLATAEVQDLAGRNTRRAA